MKNSILILLFLIPAWVFCSKDIKKVEYSGFRIQNDTLLLSFKGDIAQIIEFNNKYYCIVTRDNPYSNASFRDFYILSLNGKIEHKTKLPEKIQTEWHLDLFVKNDSILLKSYYHHDTYYFDTLSHDWNKIEDADDLIFEDEKYLIYFLDFGEWGNTVWFQNKKTLKQYELSCSFPIIHKIDGAYYLTNGKEVIFIKDPEKLNLCSKENEYKSGRGTWSQSVQGATFLYRDSSSKFDNNRYFITSFLKQDSLLLLYMNNENVTLYYLDSITLKPIQTIITQIDIYENFNQYRGDQNRYPRKLFHFLSKDCKRKGLVKIYQDHIRIINIINTDSLIILGEEQSDQNFKILTQYHLKQIDQLSIYQIDSIYEKLSVENVTPTHKFYSDDNICYRAYKFHESSKMRLLVNYFLNKDTSSVRTIMYDWSEIRENCNEIPIFELEDGTPYQKRYEKILNYLISELGNPFKTEINNELTTHIWNLNEKIEISLSLYLGYNYNNLRLNIKRLD